MIHLLVKQWFCTCIKACWERCLSGALELREQTCDTTLTSWDITAHLLKSAPTMWILQTQAFGPHYTSVCPCICIHPMYILHHPSTCNRINQNQQHTLLKQQSSQSPTTGCAREPESRFVYSDVKQHYAGRLQAG